MFTAGIEFYGWFALAAMPKPNKKVRKKGGAPDRIRTYDPQIRILVPDSGRSSAIDLKPAVCLHRNEVRSRFDFNELHRISIFSLLLQRGG